MTKDELKAKLQEAIDEMEVVCIRG